MRNADVARIFEEITELLELQGANPFRIRAYRNAALTIGDLTTSLAAIVAEDPAKLQELPGIGKDLAGKIAKQAEGAALFGAIAMMFQNAPDGFPQLVGKLPDDKQRREAMQRKSLARKLLHDRAPSLANLSTPPSQGST